MNQDDVLNDDSLNSGNYIEEVEIIEKIIEAPKQKKSNDENTEII